MSDLKGTARLIQQRFSNHHYQTDGFTWDFINATDEQVLDTMEVFEDTIDGLSGLILKSIKPQFRPQLRKQIAYLIGLRQRQAEAHERLQADYKRRTENTNKWLEANQPKKESWA